LTVIGTYDQPRGRAAGDRWQELTATKENVAILRREREPEPPHPSCGQLVDYFQHLGNWPRSFAYGAPVSSLTLHV
jgi:hypothetical protein